MRFIDLFAGIGGFHYGIDKAFDIKYAPISEKSESEERTQGRVRATSERQVQLRSGDRATALCVYSNEWDKYANSVYRRHYGECDNRDIRTVRAGELPDFDLMCGGFPCQSFSIAGKRGGFEDTRGTLFFEMARIAKEKHPRLLLFENVKGLLSHDNGRTFATIIQTIDELGYDCQWQVLNSKNHGVPQNRERIFIVGHLRGTPRPEVFPIGEDDRTITQKNAEQLSETKISGTIDSSYYKQHGDGIYVKENYGKLDDRTLEGKKGFQREERDMFNMQKGKENGNSSYRQKLAQQSTNQSSGSVSGLPQPYSQTKEEVQNLRKTTKGLSVMQQALHSMEKIRIRRLTPIETERLQGFPDNWTQYGADGELISDTQRYKMMGNAVTTNVIEAIARKLPSR